MSKYTILFWISPDFLCFLYSLIITCTLTKKVLQLIKPLLEKIYFISHLVQVGTYKYYIHKVIRT